ncbi:redox-regulated ATPase YchF [Candidatus Sumerlaeota bacterium]|nr:redox-regulated ATPase YchF [Candidatus Sumerlaeota bacterium]
MQIGLLGLPRSGKTALFHALTGGAHEGGGGGETHIAVIDVPDERFDRLVEVFKPKKATPATLQVVDLAGFSAGEGKGLTPQMLARLGTTDALCAVLRVFDDGSGDPPNPAGDLENLLLEMTLSDLQKVENRLEKLPKQIMKLGGAERQAGEAELAVLGRIRPALEEGTPIRALALTDEEEPLIRGFQFLSLRPLLVVLNLGEGVDPAPHQAALGPALAQHGTELIALNAEIEMEIAQLESEEDRRVFMEDFGLTEPGRDRLIRRLNHLLGLVTFFTVSEKEVHAWPIPAGTPAQRAAGSIHSDLERGFIRAEVIHVDAFRACGSSLAEAKRQGQLRIEGKTYLVQDGEIFHVLFSV